MPASSNSVYYIKPPSGAHGSRERPAEKTHRLVLTTTSLRNVVLANSTDVLYYEVVTPGWERHLTRISRLDPNTRCFDPVVELVNGRGHQVGMRDDEEHRDEERSTRRQEDSESTKRVVSLRFYGGGELRPVEEFLQTNQGNPARRKVDELRAWFRCKDGHKYTWHATKRRLELTRDDAPDKVVGSFHKEKRFLHVLRMSQYPYLQLHASVLESLDYIVTSFLLVERIRRELTWA
ncbi:hypothetical protein C8Q79DRAFT_1008720 [Trametes meyenii]|nr:hypothetical protein C8Q79DRAFT_1008720 [Trametes meyenii]